MSQDHIIKKQILELELSSQVGSFHLQSEVSRIYRDRVIPVMEACFSRLSDPDTTDRIDRLELDIGRIHVESMEEEFPKRVENRMQQQLGALIKRIDTSPSVHPRDERHAPDLDLFTSFLKTGRLPWWSERLGREELESRLDRLISTSPDKVKRIVEECVQDGRYLRRIIHQFSDDILLKITQLLLPALHRDIGDILRDLKTVFTESDILKTFPDKRTRLEQWRGILFSVGLNRQAVPDRFRVFTDILLHMAESLGIDHTTFQRSMADAAARLDKAGHSFKSGLPRLFASLYTSGRILDQETTAFREREQLEGLIERLAGRLQDRPLSKALSEQPIYGLDRRIEVFLQNARVLKDRISDIRNWTISRGRDRILELTGEAEKLAAGLRGQLKELVPVELRAQVGDLLGELEDFERGIRAVEKGDTAASSLSPETAKLSEIYSDPFSASEEIYIDNAGLVLLWPYLGRFFEKVGLVEENRFMNPEAAARGGLLLQYLADGSTEIPEHVLPLNKIMCGLDIDEPVEAILEISDREQEECENLLSAVIKNWGMLKNTTPDGLRRAFLQRGGVLKVREGSWLVQVEKMMHDVLLDRLPWSISVVRLPWMDGVLFVDW